MPLTLTREEKRAAIIFTSIVTVCIVAAIVFSSDKEKDPFYPSSTSTHSHGAKGTYLMLKESGYSVERWYESPEGLPTEGTKSTLIIADPRFFANNTEKQAISRYLQKGGHVLAIGPRAGDLLPVDEVTTLTVRQPEAKPIAPAMPSRITRGGPFKSRWESKWVVTSPDQMVHYATVDGPVVISYRYGEGEVIWWSASEPLTNAGITESGNLDLLLNSIGDRGTKVYWDEYFHSSRKSLWARVADTPLKWLIAQLAMFMGLAMITYSRRSGPQRPLNERPRLSSLEFIETLGGLYKRSRSPRFAVEVAWDRFRNVVMRKLGFRHDASADLIAKLCRERLRFEDEDFLPILRDCEAAGYDQDMTDAKALHLTQKLAEYQKKLVAFTGSKTERH
jgi:hypothetical protein